MVAVNPFFCLSPTRGTIIVSKTYIEFADICFSRIQFAFISELRLYFNKMIDLRDWSLYKYEFKWKSRDRYRRRNRYR